jgi:hypothetical protein
MRANLLLSPRCCEAATLGAALCKTSALFEKNPNQSSEAEFAKPAMLWTTAE